MKHIGIYRDGAQPAGQQWHWEAVLSNGHGRVLERIADGSAATEVAARAAAAAAVDTWMRFRALPLIIATALRLGASGDDRLSDIQQMLEQGAEESA